MNGASNSKTTIKIPPLRQRMSKYETECKKAREYEKKRNPNAVEITVGTLADERKDLTKYERPSPMKSRISTVGADMVNKLDSSIIFEFEGPEGRQNIIGIESESESEQGSEAPYGGMRPGMYRGGSFDDIEEDVLGLEKESRRGAQRKTVSRDNSNDASAEEERPGLYRGASTTSLQLADDSEHPEAPPKVPPSALLPQRSRAAHDDDDDDDDSDDSDDHLKSPIKVHGNVIDAVPTQTSHTVDSVDMSSHTFRNMMSGRRPGFYRGASFGDSDTEPEKPASMKTQEEKALVEQHAKDALSELLGDGDAAITAEALRLLPFSTLQRRYILAIDKLRPENFTAAKTKKERMAMLKTMAWQQQQFLALKTAWDEYEAMAQDKPAIVTEEDNQIEEDIRDIEEELVDEYLESAQKACGDKDGDDDDDDDDDSDEEDYLEKRKQWLAEARMLKAKALAMNKAKEEAKKKAAQEEKEAATKKVVKPVSDDEESEAEAEPPKTEVVKKARKKSYLDDSSDDESDDSDDWKLKKPEVKMPVQEESPKKKTVEDEDVPKSKKDVAPENEEDGNDKKSKKNRHHHHHHHHHHSKKKSIYSDSEDDSSDEEEQAKKVSSPQPKKKKDQESPSPPKKKEIQDDEDSEEESGGAEEESPVRKGSAHRKKKKKDDVPSTPPGKKKVVAKKKEKHELKEEEALTSPKRNADGTPWKYPLKGWHNTPPKKARIKGAEIVMTVPPKTDNWRKTRHNIIIDNAPFHWQKVTGDFEAVVKVSGTFSSMYDKAGIKVRLDESNWIMAGMELFNHRMHVSTLVTIDHTDWSLSLLPENAEKVGIWFCFKRFGNAYETFYSKDGTNWIQTRQGMFTDKPVLYVGICGACPMGEKDLKVTFDYYRCRNFK